MVLECFYIVKEYRYCCHMDKIVLIFLLKKKICDKKEIIGVFIKSNF